MLRTERRSLLRWEASGNEIVSFSRRSSKRNTYFLLAALAWVRGRDEMSFDCSPFSQWRCRTLRNPFIILHWHQRCLEWCVRVLCSSIGRSNVRPELLEAGREKWPITDIQIENIRLKRTLPTRWSGSSKIRNEVTSSIGKQQKKGEISNGNPKMSRVLFSGCQFLDCNFLFSPKKSFSSRPAKSVIYGSF